MREPTTYVRERGPKEDRSSVVVGKLPERLTRKIARDKKGVPIEPPPLIYSVRLDRLPDAEQFCAKSIAELDAWYERMKAAGTLPNNTADPPRKSDGGRKGALSGPENWWTPPPAPWDRSAPGHQYPVTEEEIADLHRRHPITVGFE